MAYSTHANKLFLLLKLTAVLYSAGKVTLKYVNYKIEQNKKIFFEQYKTIICYVLKQIYYYIIGETY